LKWDCYIKCCQSYPVTHNDSIAALCWENLHRTVVFINDISHVKMFQLFFPRLIVAQLFCSSFGDSIFDVRSYWDPINNEYDYECTSSWVIDEIIAQQTLGIKSVYFGAKDREVNFNVLNGKPIVGGWILPHKFNVSYNWTTQQLKLTISCYKYEARKCQNKLAMTRLLT